LGIESWKLSGGCRRETPEAETWYDNFRDRRRMLARRTPAPARGPAGAAYVGGSLTSNHHLADYRARCATAECRHLVMAPETRMKISASRYMLAALTLCAATLGSAQVAPSDAVRGATHDCTGMTGTALATCQQLNRNLNGPASSGAGTPNECSGMTGAPLASCRRLNAAETTAPASASGASNDCSGQVGDALKACRTLNGQSTEYDSAAGAAAAGGSAQQ
jgi:hypothetical protein